MGTVIGSTGTGKSNVSCVFCVFKFSTKIPQFTNKLVGCKEEKWPKSCTQEIVVDMSGFDDTYRFDWDIFRTIITWLEDMYERPPWISHY